MGLTPFRELPLSDKFMFGEVMRQEAVCKLFLEELLECKIATLRFSDKEVDISDAAYNHGIRLDVFLADENSTHYDIEMQNTDDALEKRSRYYQSSIDRRILERNKGYDKLPESFIIFICNFDHIGLGLAKYEKISHYKGTDTVYNDGSHAMQSTRARAAYRRRLRNSLTMFEKATIWLCSRPNLQTWRNL